MSTESLLSSQAIQVKKKQDRKIGVEDYTFNVV